MTKDWWYLFNIYWGDGSEHATYYNRMITADRIDRC